MWPYHSGRPVRARLSTNCRSSSFWAYSTAREDWVCLIRTKYIERMVRRWSYLNQINQNRYKWREDTTLKTAHQIVSFRATTYYRKPFIVITKFKRRSWSRRKHLTNWLVYQNIIVDWSADYLFMRRYNRFVIALRIFKYSYLIFNLLVFQTSTVSEFSGAEVISVANTIKRVRLYSSRLNSSSWNNFNYYQNVSWLYATSPYTREELTERSELSEDMAYYSHGPELYSVDEFSHKAVWLKVVSDSLFTLTLKQSVELYKVTILLTLPFIV